MTFSGWHFRTAYVIGATGFLALCFCLMAGRVERTDELNELFDLGMWLFAFIPATLMSVWGRITLFFADRRVTVEGRRALYVTAIIYFAVSIWITFDIAAHGNSTSGIAFFFFPIFSAIVVVPLIAGIAWADARLEGDNL